MRVLVFCLLSCHSSYNNIIHEIREKGNQEEGKRVPRIFCCLKEILWV